MTYTWPLPAGTDISQGFGTRPGGYNPAGGHTGTDFPTPIGTPVRAVGDGTVTFADWSHTLPADYRPDGSGRNPYWLAPAFGGIVVCIDHGPGQPVSIYAHLNSTPLNKGDKVTQGQIIGESGNTGASTGPHLHFEMMPDGWNFNNGTYGRVNPAIFCKGYWNPAPAAPTLKANQRITAAATNQRTAPNRGASVVKLWDADIILDFKGWVQGEMVDGHDVWFVGAYSDTYFWSGAFTDTTTNGIPNITPIAPAPTPSPAPAPAPAPAPVPAPQPVPAKYSFSADFDFVEVIPAALANFQMGNFPTAPTHAVIHQFGTPGVDTVSSTINTFTHPALEKVASAHFVVSGDRIIQMVSLSDRAYHAGSVGNNYVGIETDPAQDAATIASTRKLLSALNKKYGYTLTLTRHKDVPGNATSCGTLVNLDSYKEVPAPAPVVPPVAPVVSPEQAIKDFQAWQLSQYMNR